MIEIKRGLDLPIAGQPEQKIDDARQVRSVAVLGGDYIGLRPTMESRIGSRVLRGDTLFTCKKTPGLKVVAPASGVVSAINRGQRRSLVSLVIDVEEDQEADDQVRFDTHERAAITGLDPAVVRAQLIDAGLWAALRARPFNKVPSGASDAPPPAAIFVTAIDTRPLAADPTVVMTEHKDDFSAGVDVLARLTQGTVFVCTGAHTPLNPWQSENVRHEIFTGPHPAGLVGTHINYLLPANINRRIWTVGYQDVIAIGRLFLYGELWHERIISMAGPMVTRPRLLRARLGANLEELAAGEVGAPDVRLISGSVLDGHRARGITAFLGRYDLQLSAIAEDSTRRFLAYLTPGLNQFSAMPIYLSEWLRRLTRKVRLLNLTTTTGGSPRAMVPIGAYERVMPLDTLPTQLLRALLTEDLDMAIQLGCLDLAEEDLALCTFVCPGKYEYGPVLRQVLSRIEKEG